MATVLILEDQILIGRVLAGMIRNLGHEVVANCKNAAQAESSLTTLEPDVAFLDIGLAGEKNGIGVLESARENGYTGKVVFLSAYPKDSLGNLAEGVEFDGYLTKPVQDGHVRAELERLGFRV
jgi:two-component SAPR family response regulator